MTSELPALIASFNGLTSVAKGLVGLRDVSKLGVVTLEFQEKLIQVRRTRGALAGTKKDVHSRRASDTVRMADNYGRMWARIGEIERPDLPLFHSDSTCRVEAPRVFRSSAFASLL